jgi:sugar (pentulose or hexulose) kinase
MSKRFVIGVDAGTSVIKALLTDLDGNELGVAAETTPVQTPHAGWSEFNLLEDYQSVARAIRALLTQTAIDPGEVLAVGITGKGWGCCFLGEDGQPTRNGILWNDARASAYIERWAADGTLSRAYQVSGNFCYSGDCAPVSRWVVDHEPEVVARTRWALFPAAAIVYRLTGNIKLCHGDAPSLADIRRGEYSDEVFDLFGIGALRDKFPAPTPSRQVAGEVTREAAERTGLEEGTPIVLAECDVSSCATGLGVMEAGEVGILLGTAHVVLICQTEPTWEPETGALTVLLPYLDDKYLKLTGPSIATPNLDWYVDNFGQSDRSAASRAGLPFYDYLDSQVRGIPAGSDGVLYHPYLSPGGERAPIRKPTAKANFFGLGMHHSRHHLLRSVYEGVALSALDCIRATDVRPTEIALSGGGSKSDVWCQIEADVMGCRVKVPSGSEHGARGAVISALLAMGAYPSYAAAISDLVQIERVYEPDALNHGTYQRMFALYRSVQSHLIEPWDQRAALLAARGPGDAE